MTNLNIILYGLGGGVNSLVNLLDTSPLNENDLNLFESKLISLNIDILNQHMKQMRNHFTLISLNCGSLNAKFD